MTVAFGATTLTVRSLSQQSQQAPESFGALHGKSQAMRALFATLVRAAASDATVLVQAESGCGKELLARGLHEASRRREAPLVVFDCAAIAPTLIESALFGHEKGAFTGAIARRVGLVEQADGGTLFIDEIGELPLTLQPRLLRFLERREIQPVGSNEQRAVDVRVVAATHRDLLLGINQQTFREDLYYRLAVMRLSIPPLRARIDDLELLVRTLLEEQLGSKEKAAVVLRSMSSAAWAALQAHRWRGNVRELRNVIERSLALSPQGPITLGAEPATPSPWAGSADAPAVDLSGPYIPQRESAVERFDRTYLAGLLKAHEGNYSRAAAVAGIDRMYFKRLVKKYEL